MTVATPNDHAILPKSEIRKSPEIRTFFLRFRIHDSKIRKFQSQGVKSKKSNYKNRLVVRRIYILLPCSIRSVGAPLRFMPEQGHHSGHTHERRPPSAPVGLGAELGGAYSRRWEHAIC